MPCADITGLQLLEVMRRIESRGVIETAHRALQDSGQVFRYAVATGHAKFNPARRTWCRCPSKPSMCSANCTA